MQPPCEPAQLEDRKKKKPHFVKPHAKSERRAVVTAEGGKKDPCPVPVVGRVTPAPNFPASAPQSSLQAVSRTAPPRRRPPCGPSPAPPPPRPRPSRPYRGWSPGSGRAPPRRRRLPAAGAGGAARRTAAAPGGGAPAAWRGAAGTDPLLRRVAIAVPVPRVPSSRAQGRGGAGQGGAGRGRRRLSGSRSLWESIPLT